MTAMPYADATKEPQITTQSSRDPGNPDDAALLASAIGGSESAFTALYRRHGPVVYRFAYLWSGSSAVASDVTQETFIHLHQRGGAFDSARGALQSWLLGIARNLVRRHLSARYAEMPTDFADALLPESAVDDAASGDPLERLLEGEASRMLHRSIRRLPTPYRDAVVLVDLQEHSYADAAAICRCEIGTIRSRLSRARALLADAMSRWHGSANRGTT